MRRIESRLEYGDGLVDEWEPEEELSKKIAEMRDAEVRRFVRETNAKAKAEGSYRRVRSVEVEDAF